MNVLVLGSGGREHALAWKIAQSSKLNELYIAPGNGGTQACGTNLPIQVNDFDGIKSAVLSKNIDMVVVGPEDPLVNGITNFFRNDPLLKEVKIVGPGEQGAQLEGSKEFAKDFMQRHGIPTARYESFDAQTVEDGCDFLASLQPPYVLKADGLAAGKGVLIIDDLEEAKTALRDMINNEKFGEASKKVVIEEFLAGIELSVFVLTNGKQYKVLPEAKDYKRIGEGDTGLNTGGMGAISPVPFANDDFMQKVHDQIVAPTIAGFEKDGMDYTGFVFIGLMKVGDNPYVIEYNVRMGDPETEVVIPRISSDLLELLEATCNGTLDNVNLEITPNAATTVMLVSGGYPESYEKGKVIEGLGGVEDSTVFHAGTKAVNGHIETSGGRVLAITSLASSWDAAIAQSYQNAGKVSFEKMYYRTDLGFDLK